MTTVLLTAALAPSAATPNVHAGIDRVSQYAHALRDWSILAERSASRLCVVETTGHHEHEMFSASRIEVVGFEPLPLMEARGKGALEAAALDHALAQFGIDDTFVKVTGRLTVPSLEFLSVAHSADTVQIRRTLDRGFCDTRILATSGTFWRERLSNMADEVDESRGVYLEHVIAQRLVLAEFAGVASVKPFRFAPPIRGISGSTGKTYAPRGTLLRRSVRASVERSLIRLSRAKQA